MNSKIIILLLMLPVAAFSQSKKDTLEIPSHIRFIKIDGKIFEVVRVVELKEVPKINPGWPMFNMRITPNLSIDTATWYKSHPIYRNNEQ